MKIKFDKILGVVRESDVSPTNNGQKRYHLTAGQDIVVENDFQYFLYRTFIIDSGVSATINSGGILALHKGTIENNGIIINNGLLINE